MAQGSFDEALRRLLVHEGGYSNHPADPGGPTKYGITIIDYRKYIKANGTADDVKRLTVDQAKKIYKEKYWDVLNCDALPPGLDYCVFDYGVNSGVSRAGRVLRRLCGLPDQTWTVTPEVIAAVNKRDPAAIIKAMNDERLRFLKGLKTWKYFGNGWGRRVKEVNAAALAMAAKKSAANSPLSGMVAGKPGEGVMSPIKRAVGLGTVSLGAMMTAFYDWAVANPILAAFVFELIIGSIVFAVYYFHDKKKPAPVRVKKTPAKRKAAKKC